MFPKVAFEIFGLFVAISALPAQSFDRDTIIYLCLLFLHT